MNNFYWLIFPLLLLSCSTSINISQGSSLLNKDPHAYSLENPDGSISSIISHDIETLSSQDLLNLKIYLSNLTDHELDFSKNIVINFIDIDPRRSRENYQVPWDIFYGKLENELNQIKSSVHVWIINPTVTNLHYYHGDTINWRKDLDNTVRNLFFDYPRLNGGFVIIKPNGEYFYKLGEYSKSDILNTYMDFK